MPTQCKWPKCTTIVLDSIYVTKSDYCMKHHPRAVIELDDLYVKRKKLMEALNSINKRIQRKKKRLNLL